MTMTIGAVLADIFSEPAKPSEIDSEATTESVLQTMLTENTGRHMLDSGGVYGRAWEQNQGVDFDSLDPVEYEWRTYDNRHTGKTELDASVTINVYHFLTERLEFCPELDAQFQTFAELEQNQSKPWLELMEEFAGHFGFDGGDSPCTINTYNHESALSQVLQFTMFDLDYDTADELDGRFVLLQIHGGCDVRGGYTMPRVFQTYEFDLWDDARFYMACDGTGTPPLNPDQLDLAGEPVGDQHCGAVWDTDDAGYHWYEGGSGSGARDFGDYEIEAGTEGKPGTIVVNEDANEAYCPHCGRGKLVFDPPFANG